MSTSSSSLLSPLVVDVGIKKNAKCEMLLRKIDGKSGKLWIFREIAK